jgi:hypothetical protein
MKKRERISWFLLVLAGVLLIPAFLTSAVGKQFSLGTSTAQAAGERSGVGPVDQSNQLACTSTRYLPSLGGAVTIGPNEVQCSDLTVVGGSITIEGTLHGNILAFGSAVLIDGGVYGDITLFGGSVTLRPGSHVYGTIHLYGSQEIKDNGAYLNGTIDDHSRHSWFSGLQALSFPFWFLLVMIPLGLLSAWLLPEHSMFVRATIEQHWKRGFLLGLVSLLLAPVLLLILLSSIIAIPVALIVLLLLFAAWALGIIAVSWSIGEQILHAMSSRPISRRMRFVAIVLGLLALSIFGSLPVLGWLISIAASLVGLGGVLLSRFGTRLYGRPKQPLPMQL